MFKTKKNLFKRLNIHGSTQLFLELYIPCTQSSPHSSQLDALSQSCRVDSALYRTGSWDF